MTAGQGVHLWEDINVVFVSMIGTTTDCPIRSGEVSIFARFGRTVP